MNYLTRWQRPELATWPGFGRLSTLRDEIDRLFEAPLSELARSSHGPHASWTDIAIIHAGLGQNDQAFASLEKAYAHREWRLVRMKVEPMLDPVRADPRFGDLLRRLGLSP